MKKLFVIKAMAEQTESQRYNSAVKKQAQREFGMTRRQANAAINANANGRDAFQSTPGRRSSNRSVRANMARMAGR